MDVLQMENGSWVPLIEYAVRKGVSLSTLRRRIKGHEIKYQLRKGRYFIFEEGMAVSDRSNKTVVELQEQIADLKTLVQVLEAKVTAGGL